MIGVTFDIDDRQVLAALDRLVKRGHDPKPALDDIGNLLESRVHQRFDTKTDPGGVPWEHWKPATVKRHTDKEGGSIGTLLIMSGAMEQSLSHEVRSRSVAVGFGVEYAAYHEVGTKHMERRGLLTADPEAGTLGDGDQRGVMEILRRFYSSAIE
ncbi:phage virion morphogenesis protein [Methylogaea oryzae]|uniref:Phage virion morphogenesis protein n=1 Tax=Methylogaea oryzae TaxID=1295382 RepID=A0A8D4VNE8_9GAMM|nr:phage virion morphogenesis protein [Methylogaea oryzae]BBL69747.1 hypothetical protein MoryE10_03530 [Methylogaea oryzae]